MEIVCGSSDKKVNPELLARDGIIHMEKIAAKQHPVCHAPARRTPVHCRMWRAVGCALMAGAFPSFAGPIGEQVVAGQATVSRSGNGTVITQTGECAAINWQNFNIGVNESVRFAQPSAASVTLNRVLGQNPTEILGALSANGQVFLLNPNGVLFGRGAQVSVGGLVASTLGLSDGDFMAGRYRFVKEGTAGEVRNAGEISANGGYVALIGPAGEERRRHRQCSR